MIVVDQIQHQFKRAWFDYRLNRAFKNSILLSIFKMIGSFVRGGAYCYPSSGYKWPSKEDKRQVLESGSIRQQFFVDMTIADVEECATKNVHKDCRKCLIQSMCKNKSCE